MNKILQLLSNKGKYLLEQIYAAGPNKDKVVIGLGAVGLIVSMLAQLSSIKSNKNLSDDKRKFLLNQETVDGLTNTTLFFVITTVLSSFVKKQLDTGRILTPAIEKQLREAGANMVKLGKPAKSLDEILKDAKKFSKLKGKEDTLEFQIGEVVKGSEIFKTVKNMADNNKLPPEIRPFQEEADIFKTTRSGLAMIATIFASVISGNFISPFVRNKISNNMQDKYYAEHPKPRVYPKQMMTPTAYSKQNTFSSFSSITKI